MRSTAQFPREEKQSTSEVDAKNHPWQNDVRPLHLQCFTLRTDREPRRMTDPSLWITRSHGVFVLLLLL